MKLAQIKTEIEKYQFFNDSNVIDVTIAGIIANRLKLGDPVWIMIIGASSGGKTQIVKPISMSDTKFIHRVDDITENTFLSGMKSNDGSTSLLDKIGNHGIITISDFTVIMSKQAEARGAVLSQFRTLYDGEMTRHVGNNVKPLQWEGYMGIIAASTPSIYSEFEKVADMGERFIYYRMKDFDRSKATKLALTRGKFGKEMNQELSSYYGSYMEAVITQHRDHGIDPTLSEETFDRITEVASFAEKARTPVSLDFKGEKINRIPVSAFPMRVALQLMSIAKALAIMNFYENGSYELTERELCMIDWVGYSLANEEKRAVLKVVAMADFDYRLKTQTVANAIGLDTSVVHLILQNLASIGILKRDSAIGHAWSFQDKSSHELVRRIEQIIESKNLVNDMDVENQGYE